MPIGRQLGAPFLAGLGDAVWEQLVLSWFELQREVGSARRMVASNASAREVRTKEPTNRNVVGQVLRLGRGRKTNDHK